MTRLSAREEPVREIAETWRGGPALLASKLEPADLAHATVPRERLLGVLSRAVQRTSLTLLSGPAGSGKTVLAASWLRAGGVGWPAGWITLDEYDDDPATFWSYVVRALADAGVPLFRTPDLVPGEPLPAWLVPQLAADLAAASQPVVLVLDDADHLTDRSIAAGLDLLLQHAGGRLRLVICGRADPPLPLHRYRLAGTLSEVRGDQLAFTAEETRELLAAMGVPVSPAVARALCAETQGWAVGLRLAAAPLKQGVPAEHLVTSLARDDGSVAQYLFAEVLARQPAGVRRFLLRTSVTDELTPDLVDRLGGRPNARRILTGLAHANAFVEQSAEAPGGFRIHPLFREMLQAQLAYERPGEVARLHRACAAAYAEAGRSAEAVEHAMAAEDWAFVVHLLVDDLQVTRVLAHGGDPALRGLQALPAAFPGPEAAVIRTATALAAGRTPRPADLRAAAAARDGGDRPALRVSAALTCLLAQDGGDTDPAAVVARADAAAALVALLPDPDRRERRECLALISGQRAFAALRTDAAAEEVLAGLRAAAAAAATASARQLRGRAVAHVALLEALQGHLERAAHLAAEADALAAEEGRDEPDREPAAATALAWVHLRRYSLVEAREWLGRARARRPDPGAVVLDPLLAVLQCQLLRLRHEYDPAAACLEPHLRGARLPRWVAEQVVTEVVRLAVARGHVREGLRILADAGGDEPWGRRLRATVELLSGEAAGEPAPEDRSGPLAAVVDSLVVRACQLMEAGRAPAAAEELADALDLARPELLRWPFLDTPPQVRVLLRSHPRLHGLGEWLNPAVTGGAARTRGADRARQETPDVVQELSERELEVLRHLAEMLSTAEIAATMFISVNTVRTHIRSILRKLAVTRRNQAVRRARERGIL
ncbi:LuxR C-terminal-related transcriptional regulator [Geodermatophilus sp. SYSU D00815]